MRIALAQTEIFSKQYEKNKKTALSICNLAQAMEVRLLLFPEMSFTGFNMDTDYSIAAGLYTLGCRSWQPLGNAILDLVGSRLPKAEKQKTITALLLRTVRFSLTW